MRIYELINTESDEHEPSYSGTKAEAHSSAKERPKTEWNNLKITELEVQTDKVGVLAMLNGEPIITERVEAWGLTLRGGLMAWKD